MPRNEVTATQLENVLRFKGYGEPKGKFWFFGMEEWANSEDNEGQISWELKKRSEFSDFQDLPEAMNQFGSSIEKATAPTWTYMGRIVACVTKQPRWNNNWAAQEYKNKHLGRSGDETLLAELLPLSSPNTNSWRYGFLGTWKTRAEYAVEQIPPRIDLLRKVFQDYYIPAQPRFIICYGSTYWRYFREIFKLADGRAPSFKPVLIRGENRFEIGVLGRTRIALVPFLGRGHRGDLWGPDYVLISELAEALLREDSG